jgi:hypothetical protein
MPRRPAPTVEDRLKEIAPGVTRAVVLRDTELGSGASQFAVIQAVAPSLRVEVNPVNVGGAAEIERAVAASVRPFQQVT